MGEKKKRSPAVAIAPSREWWVYELQSFLNGLEANFHQGTFESVGEFRTKKKLSNGSSVTFRFITEANRKGKKHE